MARDASNPSNSTLIRLALALLIGAVAGPWFNLTHPTGLDALLNALAIALPPLLAAALASPASGGGRGALPRVGLAVALLVVILPLGDLLLNTVQGSPRFDTVFLTSMAIVLAPLVAGFTVGMRGMLLRATAGLALGCGVVAWLGVGLHNLLVPYLLGQFSPSGPSSDFGDLVFAVLLVLYVIGFAWALLLGFLGAVVRLWLARPAQK